MHAPVGWGGVYRRFSPWPGIHDTGEGGNQITLTDTEVVSNSDWGIIANNLVATRSRIAHNNNGGVIITEGWDFGTGIFLDTTISDNLGPGLIVAPISGVTMSGSTISGNHSTGVDVGSCSLFEAQNTTISGNLANGHGGGIWGDGTDCPLRLHLTHVTISGNVADADGDGNGGEIYTTGRVDRYYGILNTIIAGNLDLGGEAPDCGGLEPILSVGYNLIGTTLGCSIVGGLTGNVTDVDPLLGSLADNGGELLLILY